LSNVYYRLGTFNRDILSSIAEAEDVGMYRDYWYNLLEAKKVESGELLSLQINLYIARCIDTYGYNLKLEGITYNEVLSEYEYLQNYLDNYSPNTEVSSLKYNELKGLVDNLEPKINSIYEQGGVN